MHRNQESLIHRGLRGKEKLLEQSPFLDPVVKSSDQSTLSLLRGQDSGQCFTVAPVEDEGGKEWERDVATLIETARISRDKTTISQSDIKKKAVQNWRCDREEFHGWKDMRGSPP